MKTTVIAVVSLCLLNSLGRPASSQRQAQTACLNLLHLQLSKATLNSLLEPMHYPLNLRFLHELHQQLGPVALTAQICRIYLNFHVAQKRCTLQGWLQLISIAHPV